MGHNIPPFLAKLLVLELEVRVVVLEPLEMLPSSSIGGNAIPSDEDLPQVLSFAAVGDVGECRYRASIAE